MLHYGLLLVYKYLDNVFVKNVVTWGLAFYVLIQA